MSFIWCINRWILLAVSLLKITSFKAVACPETKNKDHIFSVTSSLFRSRGIQIFVFPFSTFFFTSVWHQLCTRTYYHILFDALRRKKCYDTKKLWKSSAENLHQKLVPNPFLILLNNPKQCHCMPIQNNAIACKKLFLKWYTLKEDDQKALKILNFNFSFEPRPF